MSKSKNGLLLLTVVLSAFLLSNGLAQEAVAEQAGSFSGNWTRLVPERQYCFTICRKFLSGMPVKRPPVAAC